MNTDRIKNIVQHILDQLGISYEEILVEDSKMPWVHIKTNESALLIGKNGETLQATNYLVKKILEKEGVETSCVIDVNGYKQKEKNRIIEKAKVYGDRAKNFKVNIKLEPMSAYERLIIHEYFADDPQLTTESEGMGRNRYIILKYKEQTNTQDGI